MPKPDNTSTGESHPVKWILRFVAVPLLSVLLGFVAGRLAPQGAVPETSNPEMLQGRKGERWYGYYGDRDADGRPYLAKDEVEVFYLPYGDGKADRVIATSQGEVKAHGGGTESKLWQYEGFRSDLYLTFSYVSEGRPEFGIGIAFLMRRGDRYIGFWVGRDVDYTNIVAAPYILLPAKASDEQIRNEYPFIEGIVEVEFNGELSLLPSAVKSSLSGEAAEP